MLPTGRCVGALGAGNQRRCIRGRSHLIVHRDAMVRPAVHLLLQVAPRRRRRPVHVRPVRAQRDVVDVPGGAWPRGRPLLAVGALPLCARPAAVRRLPRAKDGAGREGRRTNGRRDLVKELLELLLGSGLVDRPVGGGCGAGPGAERGVGHVHQGLVDCGPRRAVVSVQRRGQWAPNLLAGGRARWMYCCLSSFARTSASSSRNLRHLSSAVRAASFRWFSALALALSRATVRSCTACIQRDTHSRKGTAGSLTRKDSIAFTFCACSNVWRR